MPSNEQMARELAEKLGLRGPRGPLCGTWDHLRRFDHYVRFWQPWSSLDDMRIIEEALGVFLGTYRYELERHFVLRDKPPAVAINAPPEVRLSAAWEVVCNRENTGG